MSDTLDILTAFMKARIDEDERAVNESRNAPAGTQRFIDADPYSEPLIWQFADEDRMEREIAAKRGRLALMTEAHAEMGKLLADDEASRMDQAMAVGRARAATVAVKHDAMVYRDHPDHRGEWTP